MDTRHSIAVRDASNPEDAWNYDSIQPGAVFCNWLAEGLGVVIGLGALGWLAGLI